MIYLKTEIEQMIGSAINNAVRNKFRSFIDQQNDGYSWWLYSDMKSITPLAEKYKLVVDFAAKEVYTDTVFCGKETRLSFSFGGGVSMQRAMASVLLMAEA